MFLKIGKKKRWIDATKKELEIGTIGAIVFFAVTYGLVYYAMNNYGFMSSINLAWPWNVLVVGLIPAIILSNVGYQIGALVTVSTK